MAKGVYTTSRDPEPGSVRPAGRVMRIGVVGLALLALLVVTGSDRAGAAGYWGPGYRICHSLKVGYGPLYVSANNIRCREAVRIIREWWLGPDSRQTFVEDSTGGHYLLDRYPGWVCSDGASAGGCHKGNRHAVYNFFEPRPGRPTYWFGAEAASMRQCRDVVIRNYDGGIYTQTDGLFAKGVSCRRARGIAHAVMVDDGEVIPQPHGFRCALRSDGSGVACRRGGKRVSWRYHLARPGRQATRPVPKVECLVEGVGQTYKVAPKECVMYEHGSLATTILASMKWRNWGKKRARGRGEIHYYDHPEYTGKVVVTLSRIAKGHCVPGRYYTRARIRAVSGRSKGNDFTLNIAAGCPA